MVISHNIYAMNAQRQFKINTKSKAKNNEKLSSGYKINRSADDAAGLSISEKMRNQIRGLNQGLKNVEDGLGYIKTAEGALNEIHSILGRMGELAVQAANDINSDEDRKSIDDEIQQLKEEMGTIFDKTAFNGKKIWESDIKKSDSISDNMSFSGIKKIELYRNQSEITVNNINANAMTSWNDNINIVANEDGMKFVWNGLDGNLYQSKLIEWGSVLEGQHTINLKDNMDYSLYPNAVGIDISFTYDISGNISKQELADFFNNRKIFCGTRSNPSVSLLDKNGNEVTYQDSWTFCPMDGIIFSELYGSIDLESDNEHIIEGKKIVDPLELANDTIGYKYEFSFPNGNIYTSHGGGGSVNYYNNGQEERYDKSEFSIEELVAVSPKFIKELYDWGSDKAVNNENFHMTLIHSVVEAGAHIYMQFNYNYGSGSYSDFINTISSIDKIDISINANSTINTMVIDQDEYSSTEEGNNVQTSDNNKDKKQFYIQHGANAGEDMLISYDCLSNDYLGLNNTNVLTREKSNQAINEIQEAVKKVSAQRSQFGAYQNRLEYIAANNANYSENLQNAESNLRDTDMAKEMLAYSKNSILEQAAQSMISQANQQNQGMLQLLQ